MSIPLARRAASEFTGTALLLAVVVGSGIMGERLAGGNVAVVLLANSFATGCGLFVLILVFAPVSGAHFNPLVTAMSVAVGASTRRDALALIGAQLAGALAGVALAHAMFELPPWTASATIRSGSGQWLAEALATFGLLVTILGTRRYNVPVVAAAVGTYIAGAYWFTASTSFANPVVTIARALTPTFAGIAPDGVLPFIVAQCAGALLAGAFARALRL